MSTITISSALGWRKTLQERHNELVTLRNQNSVRETRIYGTTDKERVVEPLYDLIALDNLIGKIAREIRVLDEAVKNTNTVTKVIDYERNEDVLGSLTPASK